MGHSRYCSGKSKRSRRAFKLKRHASVIRNSKRPKRSVLSSIENLSRNTKKFLTRNLKCKKIDDGVCTLRQLPVRQSPKPPVVDLISSDPDSDSDSEISVCSVDSLDNCAPKRRKSQSSPESRTYSFRDNYVPGAAKCTYCKQPLNSIIVHSKDPAVVVNERQVLDLEQFSVDQQDGLPQIKLTNFSVYDTDGHLCPFDGNLIPDNVRLYFSGHFKSIDDEDLDDFGDFAAVDVGPIVQWWMTGLNEDENAVIGLSSSNADYYLQKASDEYAPFMKTVREKILVSKMVIEFLQSTDEECELTYENLLDNLQSRDTPAYLPQVDEDIVLKYADFIYQQVESFCVPDVENEKHPIINSHCMKKLAKLAKNSAPQKPPVVRRRAPRVTKPFNFGREKPQYMKATTTFLVEDVFQSMFDKQMNKSTNRDMKPCYVVVTPLEYMTSVPDCFKKLITGVKKKGLLQTGGPFRIRGDQKNDAFTDQELLEKTDFKPCYVRVPRLDEKLVKQYLKKRDRAQIMRKSANEKKKNTLNKRPRYDSDSDFELDSDDDFEAVEYKPMKSRVFVHKKCSWLGEPAEITDKAYFQSVLVGENRVEVGNFVTTFRSNNFAHIKYLWEDEDETKYCHVQWFMRNCDTIMGDVGNRKEIFLLEECADIPVEEIEEIKEVTMLPVTSEWHKIADWSTSKNHYGSSFFCQKRYNVKFGRFEELQPDQCGDTYSCSHCEKVRTEKEKQVPKACGKVRFDEDIAQYTMTSIRWREEEYKVGSSVFLPPGTLRAIPVAPKATVRAMPEEDKSYDEKLYPEKYRKALSHEPDGTFTEPFEVGFICGIYSKKRDFRSAADVRINVKKFYRPHNTHLSYEQSTRCDLNLLYWSDEECLLKLDKVEGKCYVAFEDNLDAPVEEWTEQGPFRFYFNKAYDRKIKQFVRPSDFARKIGQKNESTGAEQTEDIPAAWPKISRPLRTLDVFAGCGGLTEGLHQSGVAECLWAIEKCEAPARAFQSNYPDASVYIGDCNTYLNEILAGKKFYKGVKLPQKGDVELICGGPPCQGFSRMNRFRDGQYSQFKNSLVVSYLSYMDYFRPKYFVLENVRDFVSSNKGMTLKMTISCIVKMGYQVAFGILQCGKYGIPQSRRRTIIMAAAPGEILPLFPEPTHTFILSSFVDINVNGKKFITNMRWSNSAPFRMVRVRDAISDLPEIENNDDVLERVYGTEPLTYFQKLVRGADSRSDDELTEHICKPLSELVIARIEFVPHTHNADWRDIPNLVMDLPDGTRTKLLKYTHHDTKTGKSPTGALRGVCSCASNPKYKKECNEHKQANTLIPWCLPHTSARHNQWSGLYGRLWWNGYFRTVVTNPEPMGKQGRVLHPVQNRVVSVRETARSQGFPDHFKFFGDVRDKYAQIGNAVAPPLAKAIGLEIRRCVSAVEARSDN